MATTNYNCESCENLKQDVPALICNGLDDEMCVSLQNDTGLNPSAGNTDCEDLNNLNDCLIGNQEQEIELYEICDWKSFMKQFLPNLWTVLKAIICAICGIWTNIHNLWTKINEILNTLGCLINGNKNLITALNSTTQGQAFVRYYRDTTVEGETYEWNVGETLHTLDIYMDANGASAGSTPADRDYVVIISNCTDISNADHAGFYLTYYSSDETYNTTLRRRKSQHPHVQMDGATIKAFSWTNCGAVLVKKGQHVKVSCTAYSGSSGTYRLHQFTLTWIPINAGNSALDPSVLIPCVVPNN